MTPEEFDRRLAEFARRSNVWGMGEREAPLSESELARFESKHEVKLPAAYRHIALTYGAGDFGFCWLYSARDSDIGIARNFKAFDLPHDFLPISDNGCGDFYGFMIRGGTCEAQIAFADHEVGWQLSTTDCKDLFEFVAANGFEAA